MRSACLFIGLIAIIISSSWSEAEDADKIVKACIERHGGESKINDVKDIYAKMDVCTYSKKGDIESTFFEYFRLPDKLRIEIHPLIDPPTKLSWDGQNAWQMVKSKTERLEEPGQIDRLKESLRLAKLMILTNFLKGKGLLYLGIITKGDVSAHKISQITDEGDKIYLYINVSDFTLLAVEFFWKTQPDDRFNINFYKHTWMSDVLLPSEVKVYKNDEFIMKVNLKVVKLNSLTSSNTFFTDLGEEPKFRESGRIEGRRERPR